jgi:dATP pyrophosphohydrolase
MSEFPTYIQVHVFRLRNGVTEHLVLRRAPDEKDYPDMMQVVTGAIEQGETADDAAIRELQEELGMQPDECYVLPIINSFYHARRHTIDHSAVFAARIALDAKIKLSAEHCEYFWCLPEEAENKLVMPSHRQGVHVLCEYILDEEKKKYLTRIV